MDSELLREGRLLDIIDDQWREDRLPYEDIGVPQQELPEAEPDNGQGEETIREQEQKWLDLALDSMHEQQQAVNNS